MDVLQSVLGQRTGDIASVLESQAGIRGTVARRFVLVAGAELLDSYNWQKVDLDPEDLSEPRNVRDLLSAISAHRIASAVELPVTDVWQGLRTFVPCCMQLAESHRRGTSMSQARRPGVASRGPRRTPSAPVGFLPPME